MKQIFLRLYGWLIAKAIEYQLDTGKYYNQNKQSFMCTAVNRGPWRPLRYLVKEHLDGILRRPTLIYHIEQYYPGWVNRPWCAQYHVHVRFYRKMCAELRKGNFTWGKHFTYKDLGIQPYSHTEEWRIQIMESKNPQDFATHLNELTMNQVAAVATDSPRYYDGPFGRYRAGCTGAVLNALCEQEGRPVSRVGNYVIGPGVIHPHHGTPKVIATFAWAGEDIVFDWKTA